MFVQVRRELHNLGKNLNGLNLPAGIIDVKSWFVLEHSVVVALLTGQISV